MEDEGLELLFSRSSRVPRGDLSARGWHTPTAFPTALHTVLWHSPPPFMHLQNNGAPLFFLSSSLYLHTFFSYCPLFIYFARLSSLKEPRSLPQPSDHFPLSRSAVCLVPGATTGEYSKTRSRKRRILTDTSGGPPAAE